MPGDSDDVVVPPSYRQRVYVAAWKRKFDFEGALEDFVLDYVVEEFLRVRGRYGVRRPHP